MGNCIYKADSLPESRCFSLYRSTTLQYNSISLIYFLLPLFTCHSNYIIHSFPISISFSLPAEKFPPHGPGTEFTDEKKLTYCKRIKSHLERLHLENRASNHHTLLFLPFLRFNEMFNQYSPNQQSCDEEALWPSGKTPR